MRRDPIANPLVALCALPLLPLPPAALAARIPVPCTACYPALRLLHWTGRTQAERDLSLLEDCVWAQDGCVELRPILNPRGWRCARPVYCLSPVCVLGAAARALQNESCCWHWPKSGTNLESGAIRTHLQAPLALLLRRGSSPLPCFPTQCLKAAGGGCGHGVYCSRCHAPPRETAPPFPPPSRQPPPAAPHHREPPFAPYHPPPGPEFYCGPHDLPARPYLPPGPFSPRSCPRGPVPGEGPHPGWFHAPPAW